MTPIDVRRTGESQAVRIARSGELDIATVDEVERSIFAAVDERPATLVVDLSGLSFMDSTGLRLILASDARRRATGDRLVLIPGPEAVHRVFRLALLEDRLQFERPTPEEAEG